MKIDSSNIQDYVMYRSDPSQEGPKLPADHKIEVREIEGGIKIRQDQPATEIGFNIIQNIDGSYTVESSFSHWAWDILKEEGFDGNIWEFIAKTPENYKDSSKLEPFNWFANTGDEIKNKIMDYIFRDGYGKTFHFKITAPQTQKQVFEPLAPPSKPDLTGMKINPMKSLKGFEIEV